MVFPADLVAFGLYFAQQIGVLLAIGAQTIILSGYLIDVHKENFNEHLRSAARQVRFVGIALIILSGAGIAAIHYQAGELLILEEPAFVFKWFLVALLLGFHLLDKVQRGRGFILWLEGASWYALFLVHTLAPVVSWQNLLIAYGAWLLAFGVVWGIFLLVVMPKKKKTSTPTPAKLSAAAPAIPTPVAPAMPPVQKAEPPKPEPVQAPPASVAPVHPLPALHPVGELPAAHTSAPPVMPPVTPPPPLVTPSLTPIGTPLKEEKPKYPDADVPALHVMPKRKEDIGTHMRGPVIQFSQD